MSVSLAEAEDRGHPDKWPDSQLENVPLSYVLVMTAQDMGFFLGELKQVT